MKLGNKGYSMVELFAVIFIASAIIFPMITTLVNNFEINDRLHNRRSAAAIATGTEEGFSRFTFSDIKTLVDNSNIAGDYYITIDGSSCNQLPDSADEALCNQLFGSIFNNLTLGSDEFKVFIHDYHLTTASKNSLMSDPDIPDRIKEQINNITPTTDPNPELYHIYVWIEYDTPTGSDLIVKGLFSND